jgi:hypothetical protein
MVFSNLERTLSKEDDVLLLLQLESNRMVFAFERYERRIDLSSA